MNIELNMFWTITILLIEIMITYNQICGIFDHYKIIKLEKENKILGEQIANNDKEWELGVKSLTDNYNILVDDYNILLDKNNRDTRVYNHTFTSR